MVPKDFDELETSFLPDHEILTLAKDQPEYLPLQIVRFVDDPEGRFISRWTFSEEERKAIAAGEDLYLEQLTFGRRFQPILPTIGLRDFCPKD